MIEEGYSVKLNCPIKCSRFIEYSIDCRPETKFSIVFHDKDHFLESDLIQTDNELIALEQNMESFLAALSIKSKAAFSRVYWKPCPLQNDIKIMNRSPYSPFVPGLTVRDCDTPKLDSAQVKNDVIKTTNRILAKVETDSDAFTILGLYTTANWFLNANMLREAAIAYHGVVEAICARKLSQISASSEAEIKKAVGQNGYGLGENEEKIILRSHIIRGILAHGNVDKYQIEKCLSRSAKGPFGALLLSQHALGTNVVASAQLTFPALDCKDAADILLGKYFEL